MGSQQSSRSQATRKPTSTKQTTTELDFIFKRPIFWRPSYIEQSAWLEHIPFAFWLVDTLQPGKIVELGSHYGSSYFSFCQAVAKLDLETQCYAVDTWGGDEHAGQYGEEVYRQVSEYNQQHYSDISTLVRSTFDQALDHFSQGSIDLLHIDGLHTLEAVRHDFESWLPKLSEKAVVIMHDTNVRERGFGVFQLLDELKQQYPHFEFAHGHGLGVIGVGSQQLPEMLSLYSLSGNASATRQVQEVFSRLGKACSYSWENNLVKRQMATLQQNQQAENQEVVEQNALERGQLAERITAQHHALKTLEEKLAQRADQAEELTLQQQQVSALTADLAQLKQHATEVQATLTQCEQQRDQSLISQQDLETEIKDTRQTLALTASERDQITRDKQSLFEQHTELLEQQSAMQQQLHEHALHLNEEAQRIAELTLALNKSNAVLNEYSHELKAQQQQIDKQAAALTAAYQQQDELSQTLATESAHWQQQQQVLMETNRQLHSQCDELTADLEARADEITELSQTLAIESAHWQQQQQELVETNRQLHLHCDGLNADLETRAGEIIELRQALTERAQTIVEQTLELDQTRSQLSALNQRHHSEQVDAQQQLSQLNQSLDERFTEIAILTQCLEEREKTSVMAVEEHSTHQQAWQTEQANLIRAQTELKQLLTSLEQQAAQQQAHLGTQLSELVRQNEDLETNISERFSELAIMTRHTEYLTRELQQKEQQLLKAKERAQNLKQTVSWKLTAPVRALGRTFKDSSAITSKATLSSAERITTSGLFNEQWYIHRYPEVADSGLSAIEHFIQVGADKGYSPSELFDTRWYLQTYADVAQGTINPLIHYIMHGKVEQRHCLPDNLRK